MTRTLVRFVFAILIAFFLWRCAVQTTPTGGPKDETPPVLLKSSPKDKEINFKGEIVELTFDEKVKLNNPTEEIIITPSPGKIVDFKISQNKFTIEPKDGWKDSTTYSISFREGIQDATEGNSADTLHLAFSTGPIIDSLSLYGRIKNGITEEIPKKITVAIYQADTTDIFKHSALYFTKTDKNGRFKLENLKSGTFYLYAFDDANKNLKVESTTEKFGFKSIPITLTEKKPDSIFLSVVKADSRPLKINSIRNTDKATKVTFNKSVVSYKADTQAADIPTNSFGDNRTELIFYNTDIISDSIKISLKAKDSIELSLDTAFYIKRSGIKTQHETFHVNYTQPTMIIETGIFSFNGSFNKPVSKIDSDSIFIKIDSLNFIRFEKQDFVIDNTEKTISLVKRLDKKAFSKEKVYPALIMRNVFLTSIQNDSSKAETKPIKIQAVEKTATLQIQLKTNETNFIIQLLNASGTVLESIKNVKNYTFKNLDPITYKIRVIVDKNKNGKWDTANIFTRSEPELVYYYKSQEGRSEIATRENSDIGPLILTF